MQRKVLVTGANGFVARYLVSALKSQAYEVIGVDMVAMPSWRVDKYYSCNLIEADAIRIILSVERPDAIVHLAAVSSVAKSWLAPVDSFLNNTNIFLNLVDAVRILKLHTRILSVGSSEEYGNISHNEIPIHEGHLLSPCSPYAVARVSQEQLSCLYANGYGLDIVMTRSFNQIGPGQLPTFVVPSFVKQLVDGKTKGLSNITVKAGDLTIVRDFLDVRDAVSAYLILLERGVVGSVYNICSGIGRTLREVLDEIASIVGVSVSVETDPSRIRPADNHVIVGDNSKIKALGWTPQFGVERSISDMIEHLSGRLNF